MINEYKNKMTIYEANYDWRNSILYLKSIEDKLDLVDKLNFSVRVMFLITYFFLEGEYSDEDEKEGMSELILLFEKTYREFHNNSDFLFCISVITNLNEYAFKMDIAESDNFLNDSIKRSPNVQLYQNWFLVTKRKMNVDKNYLNSDFVNSWKIDKGLLGSYVIDYLKKF